MFALLKAVFYQPLYNILVFLITISPHFIDVGIVVIFLTILVKLALFPLTRKSVTTQLRMKEIQPELDSIKEKYKSDKTKQAELTMKLYKDKGINPFSSFLLILIQAPIVFSLYYIFYRSGLPAIHTELLYSFVHAPTQINTVFLGLIDVVNKSFVLALIAAVTNFLQVQYSIPPHKRKVGAGSSFKDDLAHSMNIQMRFIFPLVVFFIAYHISGAVALYWATSNLFTLGQELYVRQKIKKSDEKKAKK